MVCANVEPEEEATVSCEEGCSSLKRDATCLPVESRLGVPEEVYSQMQAMANELRKTQERCKAAEHDVACLRGDATCVSTMEVEELTKLEEELWGTLQRVSAAKSDAFQTSFESRIQV